MEKAADPERKAGVGSRPRECPSDLCNWPLHGEGREGRKKEAGRVGRWPV